MWIEKYYKDGYYVDPTGAHWDEAEDFLQGFVLGFCCCGNPEANLKYVAAVLQHLQTLKEQVWTDKITYEQWVEDGKNIGTDQQLSLVYYFLDSKELTEHGGSIPGWLTDEGLELLEDIKELYNLD